MNQPVTRSEKIHEGAEIDDFHDLAIVDDADFGFGHNAADPVDRSLRRISVDRGDLDRAVIVYIDLGPGRLDDLADDLTARTNDLADFSFGMLKLVIRGALLLTMSRAPVKAFAISPRM